jgi:eukaryotic-like serine/threonine-protein kinase
VVESIPGRFVGDRYELVRELGRGGMGVVYLGRDLRLDMDVAIKFRGMTHSDATLWLKREFRAVASLRHRNLVELYELVAHDRSCYFTMEYLPGIDPRRWVEHRQLARGELVTTEASTRSASPLHAALTETRELALELGAAAPARMQPQVDFARVYHVLAQLAEGLAFLHAHGVIHRDVKPSNAICSGGTVKLLDFGLAVERHRQEGDLARETRVVGTAAYLAPEYIERLAVSPAMDVYALGVLAFELITGAPPFSGSLHMLARLHRKGGVPRASSFTPDVPPDLDALIDRMLARDPAARPTALQIANALSGAQSASRPRALRRAHRFVGRDRELAQIAARIEDAAPRGRLVLVRGESGAGKSALIEEALGRARGRDTLTWRGRCHERERVPYRAFDLIIDDLATELAGDPRLAREIAHAGALGRVFPALSPLIDPELGAEPPAADLRVERERALVAMAELFHRLLRAPRGVAVIDDLQWADEDSLELLALLVERVARPLTVLASWTADPTGLPEAQRLLVERLGDAVTVVDIAAMDEDDLAHLIGELAPQLPAERLRAAASLAAGSPYLAELIGRELGEAGAAEAAGAGAAGALVAGADAELRRLTRLDPEERSLAEIAALAGGAVTFEQLRDLADLPSSRVQSALRGLQDARVLRATPSPAGDPVYVFYHQRLREAARAATSPAARRARHQRFAEWYEREGGEPGQLAYHWQHAGELAQAAAAAREAARAARAQLAWGIAADWYQKALELGVAEPLDARAGRAEMLFLGGKLAEAADEFLALSRADHPGDRWRVRAAEALLKLGEIERGLGVLDDVLERRGQRRSRSRAVTVVRAAAVAARWLAPLPTRPAPIDEVLASAYRVIASFLSTPYPIEALEYVLRGIALAERTGDGAARSQGMAMLGAYLAAGSLGRYGDRALAAAERLAAGAPYPSMVAAGCGGILAMLRGDWAGMRTAHEDGERICRRMGLERSWEASFLRSYWALGEYYAGEPARALALIDELTGAADDLFGRAMLGSYRGRALVMAGDLSAARTLGRELAGARAARHGMGSIYRQVFTAELALAEHDWARAAALAGELAAQVRAQWLSVMPAISVMVEVIAATADLGLAAAGDREAAARAAATARRVFRRGRSSFYAVTALRLWGQAEAHLGRRGRARRLLGRAAAAAHVRGGKVDRLALAALTGATIDAGPLGPAVAWATGGAIAAAGT